MIFIEVLREAWRNVTSGTSRAVLLAMTFVLTVGGFAVADVRTLSLAQNQVAEWRRAGGGIVTFIAPKSIDGPSCQSLSRVAGVMAAGALREVTTGMQAAQLGRRTVPLYEVTQGILAMLDVRARSSGRNDQLGSGVILSEAAADLLGRQEGGRFESDGTPVAVTGVLNQPSDGLVTPFDFSAISLVPARGEFDACWLAVWPPNDELSHLARSTLSVEKAPADVRTEYRPLNPRIAATIDPKSIYAGRATRWAPIVVVVVATFLGFAALMLRRLEFSSALHAGIRRRDLVCQHIIEAASWSGFGCALLVPVALLARLDSVSDPVSIDRHAGSLLLLGLIGVVFGTLSATILIREHHLLDHFKRR